MPAWEVRIEGEKIGLSPECLLCFENLYSYPEMQTANATHSQGFLLPAKEHVELETAGQSFFTYPCNSIQQSDITNNTNRYHPVVVTQAPPTT